MQDSYLVISGTKYELGIRVIVDDPLHYLSLRIDGASGSEKNSTYAKSHELPC
jgi:hypothetical protein